MSNNVNQWSGQLREVNTGQKWPTLGDLRALVEACDGMNDRGVDHRRRPGEVRGLRRRVGHHRPAHRPRAHHREGVTMSHTKTAILAVLTLTTSTDRGPAWWDALVALAHMTALVYLAWYVWRGPEVVETRPEPKACNCHHQHLGGYDAHGGQR
jgi:hypothetical protein